MNGWMYKQTDRQIIECRNTEKTDKLIDHCLSSSLRLLQMLDELKAMRQLKLTLPVTSTSLLNQELRIKGFNQQLQYEVDQLFSAIQKIDQRVSPLFEGLIATVTRLVVSHAKII